MSSINIFEQRVPGGSRLAFACSGRVPPDGFRVPAGCLRTAPFRSFPAENVFPLEFPTIFNENPGFAASKTNHFCRFSYHIQLVPADPLPFLRRPPSSTDPTANNGSKRGSLESQGPLEESQVRPNRPSFPHFYASLLWISTPFAEKGST